MLRFASSVVQSVSDTLAPLYRSPVESLTHSWLKVEEALLDLQQQQQTLLSAAPASTAPTASTPSSSSPPPPWCTPALLNALNGMVEAVRREAGEKGGGGVHPSGSKATLVLSPAAAPRPSSSSPTLTVSPSPPFSTSPPSLSPAKSSTASSPTLLRSHSPSPSSLSRRGACADFLLQDDVIETLCRFALPNRPVGLRTVLLRTVDALLTTSPSPLLARPETAGAVMQLVERARDEGELKRKNSGRLPLLTLCQTITSKIHNNAATATTWLTSPPTPLSGDSPAPFPPAYELASLLVAMLNFFSVEGKVAAAALFNLACTPHQAELQRWMGEETGLVRGVIGGVVELVQQLPPVSLCPSFAVLFRTNEAASQLLDRLRFIDALCHYGPLPLTLALCALYTTEVLEKTMTPLLLDVSTA